MKPLDFIIIGAQKAGTTAMFNYLRLHPCIYMPLEKEIPFFCKDKLYERGWGWFAGKHYSRTSTDHLWGKATPSYLADSQAPTRIKCTMPDVRLIALLRNPISRAISHYKMARRRGIEQRSFERVVSEMLSNLKQTERARVLPGTYASDSQCYLVWGEYGRLLDHYYSLFSKEQILVLFSEDLADDCQRQLDRCLRFLNIEPGFTPRNLGKRYHVGGTQRRIPWLHSRRAQSYLRRVPGRMGKLLTFWLEIWNTVPEQAEAFQLQKETRRRLIEFYRQDIYELQRLLGRRVPWTEFLGLEVRVERKRRTANQDGFYHCRS